MGFVYHNIKIKNFCVGLSHFRLWTIAAHHTFSNIFMTYT